MEDNPRGNIKDNINEINASIEQVAEQKEEEHGHKRSLKGKTALLASVVACIFGMFQLITGGHRPLPGVIQSVVHVGFTLTLIFLYFPARKKTGKHVTLVDWLFIVLTASSVFYIIPYSDDIISLTAKNSNWQIVFGVVIIGLILEASRRSLGLIFPILVGAFLLYAFFGHLIPGVFGHAKFSPAMIIRTVYFDAQGLWGHLLQMSSTLLALFLTFGAVLLKSGGGEAFLDIGFFVSARSRGGSAKVAAVTSGLFGMISGSCTANAATIGTFTIPLMKRGGFSPEFSSAVEGVAGTGGMLMPPIMGAGAFLMAQFLGISYARIALAAIVPAVLYYAGLFFSIHFQALKRNMQIPDIKEFKEAMARFGVRRTVIPLIPILLLIACFMAGYTVQLGAFLSSILALILMLFTMGGKWNLNRAAEYFRKLFGAFSAAGVSVAQVAVLLASAQIMVSILGLTGLAIKFSNLIVQVGQSNILATLILGMVLLFFLGMGVPVTAVYVIGASIVAPAFILLGREALPAHLFTFYFSCLGAITPPVCGAIFITSALAKSDWWKSGWLAVRLALPGFIVPYVFIFKPTLLLMGAPLEIFLDVLTAFVGVILMAAGGVGYLITPCRLYERVCLIVCGVLLVLPNLIAAFVGLAVTFTILMMQMKRKKQLSPVSLT